MIVMIMMMILPHLFFKSVRQIRMITITDDNDNVTSSVMRKITDMMIMSILFIFIIQPSSKSVI